MRHHHGMNTTKDRAVLAAAGWAESPDFRAYYRDPCSGRLFIRRFAASIQRQRNRMAGVNPMPGLRGQATMLLRWEDDGGAVAGF